MTPLEKAKAKEKTCRTCEKSERVGNLLYCGTDGKIIMPMFEDIQCCRGKEGEEVGNNDV